MCPTCTTRRMRRSDHRPLAAMLPPFGRSVSAFRAGDPAHGLGIFITLPVLAVLAIWLVQKLRPRRPAASGHRAR